MGWGQLTTNFAHCRQNLALGTGVHTPSALVQNRCGLCSEPQANCLGTQLARGMRGADTPSECPFWAASSGALEGQGCQLFWCVPVFLADGDSIVR